MLAADGDEMRGAGVAEGGVNVVRKAGGVVDDRGLDDRRHLFPELPVHFLNVLGNRVPQFPERAGGIPDRAQLRLRADEQHTVGRHARPVLRHAQRRLEFHREAAGGQIGAVGRIQPDGQPLREWRVSFFDFNLQIAAGGVLAHLDDCARAFDGDAVERIIGRDEQRAVHERESNRQQRRRRICERAADARLTAQKACYAEITAQHARNKEQKQRDIVLQIDRNGSAAREKRAERCEDAVFEHWSHPLRCLMPSERKAAALPDTECRPDTWRRPRQEWPCVRRPCRPTP